MIPSIEVPGWKVYYDPPTKSIVAVKETIEPTILIRNLKEELGLEVRIEKKVVKVRRGLQEKTLKECRKLLDVYDEIYRYLMSNPFEKMELIVEATILGTIPFTLKHKDIVVRYTKDAHYGEILAGRLRRLLSEYGRKLDVYTSVSSSCEGVRFVVSIEIRAENYYEFEIRGIIKATNVLCGDKNSGGDK